MAQQSGAGTDPQWRRTRAGPVGSWAPIGAVQTATGYDVALALPGANEFTVWAVNSSGAYVSSLVGVVAGNDTTLELLETTFNQDLNGDTHIGLPPPTVIQTDGTTSLVTTGGNYFLDTVGSNSLGPELTLNGAALGPAQLGSWTPIGAVQTATGYDVAFKLAGANEYTVWATNSSGAYVSSLVGVVAGNDTTLESLETTFNQDLNGDTHIGLPPPTVIQTDGTTSLVTTGGNYFLDTVGSNSLGPELTLNGAALRPSWAAGLRLARCRPRPATTLLSSLQVPTSIRCGPPTAAALMFPVSWVSCRATTPQLNPWKTRSSKISTVIATSDLRRLLHLSSFRRMARRAWFRWATTISLIRLAAGRARN